MSEIALKVENLSKQYRLGEVGTGTLSHDINRWWHKIRGKEDPYAIVGDTNDRSSIGNSEYVWALKDIDFEVKRGEILGIIGKNGAGKSTLLKILSKVTGPTTGSIKMNGRVASLLEVGTGMHPELTGRENIYLNGAILGMTKAEVKAKLDEIVDFSGCAKYVDTPVKRYSSGMMVRLGFAVAAHLEPEILIVDEVLAVGDAEFQKKAVGKMKDVSQGGGRTVLFVSHNMASVRNLCERGVLLKNGTVDFIGDIETTINNYIASNISFEKNKKGPYQFSRGNLSSDMLILGVELFDKNEERTDSFQVGDSFKLKIHLNETSHKYGIGFIIKDFLGDRIASLSSIILGKEINENYKIVSFNIPSLKLVPGQYFIDISIAHKGVGRIDYAENFASFNITEQDYYGSGENVNSFFGKFLLDGNIEIEY
jgi:lipopolysaccharide transport system ATP-binding protein